MNKRCFWLTIITYIFCFQNCLWGQIPLFHNILVPEAMGIYCMGKDEKGLMWIGTGVGLYCYDGYRCYRRNGTDVLNPQGIQTMNVEGNTIYLGCGNGFYSYKIESEEYRHLIPEITEVNATFLYGNKIYIGCNQGLWAWDKVAQQAEVVCGELKQVYAIAKYGEGLLVGTLNGLYFVKDGKAFKRSYSSFVGIIMPDAESDGYWIGTEGNLFHYEADMDTLSPVIELSGNYVKTLAYDSSGRLYIGTDNGLYIKDGFEFRLIRHDTSNPWSIQNNIICDIFIDELQNLWIGSDIGLSMLTHQSLSKFYPLRLLTGRSGGNVIHAIAQDKDGNVWMGGTDGLIRYRKDGVEASVTWYSQSDDCYRILHNRIRSIYNDRDGDVWVITDHGINLYDKNTGKLRNFIVENEDGRFTCRWAYCLCMDEQRNLWIGAYNEGVFVINKEKLLASDGCSKADVFYGESNGQLSGSHVYSIIQDMAGGIWVSSNGGIDRIVPQTRHVEHISDQFATCMLCDLQQCIWISLDGGIQCLDSDGKIVREFTFKENDRPIHFIELIEVENRIWAFTQNDCRVIHSDGSVSVFSLPSMNVRSAYYSSVDHQVLVGGMDNVMYLDRGIVDCLTLEQKLTLAELRVNGQRYAYGQAPAFLTHLTLEHDENNLEFCLTDTPDSRNITVPYAYCLEGNDNRWLPLGPDRKIVLNALPYGNYALVVGSVDGMGNVLHEVYRLDLNILPPWYLSVGAKICYAILILLFVWGGLRFYLVRKKLNEEKEKYRKTIEQQEIRSSFFNHLSNELKKMLVHIIAPTEELLGSVSSKQPRELTEEVRNSATQINALIRQAFDLDNPLPIDGPEMITVDVIGFCRGFVQRFEKTHEEFHMLTYSFQSTVKGLYRKIGVVRFDSVFNILMNYLSRHTETGGKVQLYIQQTADRLDISIKGFPAHIPSGNSDKLFERYRQINDSMIPETDSELYLAYEYMSDMNGELDADYNKMNAVLTFKINFSLNVMPEGSSYADEVEKNVTRVRRNTLSYNTEANDDFLSMVTSIIEKHIIDSDFNVSMLQYESGMGDKMLYRRLKQLTGLSPVEYIRHIRMNRAALLLKEGKFSVSEVMYMVGFSNSSYFSKCFQSVYGVSPTQYRRNFEIQKQDFL